MPILVVGNKGIQEPLINILKQVKFELRNGKLKDIVLKNDSIVVTCPHHNDGKESNPDCHINILPNKEVPYGYCHCFACGYAANFPSFIGECFDRDEEYGTRWLLDRYGNVFIENEIDLPPLSLNGTKGEINLSEEILDRFQPYHPYMTQRKITNEAIETFKIKYDDETKCIVFPVWDEHNNLVMLTRRSVNSKKFIIPPNAQKPVYLLNFAIRSNCKFIMVTEGQIDALTALGYGMPCVATMGSPSNTQFDALNKSGIRIFITMFDNDESGRRFTELFNRKIKKDRIVINVTSFPYGKKDINDLSYEEFLEVLKFNGVDFDSLLNL